MTRILTLYETYSRQDVHDIFEPDTNFTPGTGTWGILGIVSIKRNPGDFVFFVTFGREVAGHQFDEWITDKGVINWQSQPRQSLNDYQIQQFIHHNPITNNIFLFLRTKKRGLFTYLGRLAYFSHDPQRENPVWIQWQILDWPIPPSVMDKMGINLNENVDVQLFPPQALREFEWKGKQYIVQIDELIKRINDSFIYDPPNEAIRYREWFVKVDNNRVSPKWIFHLITSVNYDEFDSPTARTKLAQIGLFSELVENKPELQQLELETSRIERKIKEKPMYKPKRFKSSTVEALENFLNDLSTFGEISLENKDDYALTDYHYLDLLRSTLVVSNPFAFIASPRLINLLPFKGDSSLFKLINLSYDNLDSSTNFPENAFKLPDQAKYKNLDFAYHLKPIPEIIYEDKTPRPIFLIDYLSYDLFDIYRGFSWIFDNDWDDWSENDLIKLPSIYTDPKRFIHSTLPIQNKYGGQNEIQLALWKSAFYWVMLQLIILSDPQTGSMYDPRITLFLSNGWKKNSQARLYLQGEYLGDLVDCLESILARFNWIWVNRTYDTIQDQESILGLLRLFLKLEIAELGKDGCVQFTIEYRRQLFETQTKARLQYINSKDARDQLREAIKELKK